MRLFDSIERSDDSPAEYAEPAFRFLNRSARPVCDQIRKVLGDWFSSYPLEGQSDLYGRFRSDNNVQHRGAFFELLLHGLLIRLGCNVQLHPELGKSNERRPDFLVDSPICGKFFVEAVLATDESDKEATARARMNQVYDALNRMNSPDFFIGMELTGEPVTPPSAKGIRSFLEENLARLNPDEVAALLKDEDFSVLPRWRYEHDGWTIDFFPVPKSPNARGKSGIRPVGLHFSGIEFVDSKGSIRQAILTKAGSYGNLDHPYVIAVNALGEHVDEIDVREALFGTEQWTIQTSSSSEPADPKMTRQPDGVWTSASGPRYTRVSAVLVTKRLLPWNIPRVDARLYHNPWAQQRCTCELTRLPQAVPENNRMTLLEGTSLGALLGLSPEWPESSAF